MVPHPYRILQNGLLLEDPVRQAPSDIFESEQVRIPGYKWVCQGYDMLEIPHYKWVCQMIQDKFYDQCNMRLQRREKMTF